MKKFILILSVALLFGCKVQEKPKVQVDTVLMKTVTEFINDAEANEVNLNAVRDSLNYITVLPIDKNLYGLYSPKTRQVIINVFVPLDETIMRKVIYHELGHVFGLEHDKAGIMSTNLSPSQIHMKYCPYDNPVGQENWELHKIILFRKIKELQSEKKK